MIGKLEIRIPSIAKPLSKSNQALIPSLVFIS